MKRIHLSPLLVVALAMVLVFAVACDRPDPQVALDTPQPLTPVPLTPQQTQTEGNPTPTLPPVVATVDLGTAATPGTLPAEVTPEVSPLAPATTPEATPPATTPEAPTQPQVQPTAPQPQVQPTAQVPGVYTVKTGDTLFSVARAFGINPYAIAAANHLPYPYTIYPGQQLTIPGNNPVPPGPTAAPPGPAPVPPKPGCRYYYVVRPGDNLFRISLAFGVPMSTIATANGIYNYNLIFAGQTLCIP